MKVLITIASEQTWPQIIPMYHLKNKDGHGFDKIIILYSGFNPSKSKDPATRLKTFIEKYDLSKETYLQEVEGEIDFSEPLNNLVNNLGITTSDDVYVNFTGGTKTMSLMLSIWAAQKGYILFYTYSGSRLQFYKQISNGLLNKVGSEDIDVRITNDIDPIDIVKLQCGEEFIKDEGRQYKSSVEINNKNIPQSGSDGILLERAMLHFFQDSNIKYRHSIKLKAVKASTPHEEIDVLLNYNGTLWLVECKKRKNLNFNADVRDRIKRAYKGKDVSKPGIIDQLIIDLEKNLSSNKHMQFKSDVFSAKKISGINAKVLWVVTDYDNNDNEFCKSENIEYILVKIENNSNSPRNNKLTQIAEENLRNKYFKQ